MDQQQWTVERILSGGHQEIVRSVAWNTEVLISPSLMVNVIFDTT